MIIYGINPVKEAIESGVHIRQVFVSERSDKRIREIANLAHQADIKIVQKKKDFFRNITSQSSQCVAADIDFKTIPFEKLIADPFDKLRTFLILDLIEDPRNLGAIFRNAAASRVDGVIIQTHRSCKITPTVFAASAGTLVHVRISEISNIKTAMRVFKEEGFQIIGADSEGTSLYWEVDYSVPTVLILGSEGKGLRRTVKEMCDVVVQIPMAGEVSSLNVSVASGIVLYEILRQRWRNQ